MVPGLKLYYADPAQHLITVGWDLDYIDRDLDDLSDISDLDRGLSDLSDGVSLTNINARAQNKLTSNLPYVLPQPPNRTPCR